MEVISSMAFFIFMSVKQYYQQELKKRDYVSDAAQEKAIDRLQLYYDDWIQFRKQRSNRIKKIFNRPDSPRGVYMWGGVGRGKSFLMDSFYNTVPVKRKTRVHFHEFMRGVHEELKQVRGTQDPLDEVAKRIASKYRLICFDEFHVSDVADAMILYKLLLGLFDLGTSFIMTSNYQPSDLYPDGLHRDRILPAIDLIYKNMDILNVDAGTDYRRQTISSVRTYLHPLSPEVKQELKSDFDKINGTNPLKDTILNIENRDIKAIAVGEEIAWFDFETLCGGPRSQNDYLDLASRFETIILSDVPCMDARHASQARRFTWLIDVLYDHKVKLIISAQCPADELYTQGPMAQEFHRTVSRIVEMQSKEYLQTDRRFAVSL